MILPSRLIIANAKNSMVSVEYMLFFKTLQISIIYIDAL
jgi:hypothetical protein